MALKDGQYEAFQSIFQGRRLPLAFVDLDAFDANAAHVAWLAVGTASFQTFIVAQRLL